MTGAVDLDGNPRRDVFGGGVVDMGAYEFRFIAGTSIMIW
jgi:hypothetical protein